MGLRDQISDSVDTVFFESGGLKETVSYLPYGQETATSIEAIVEEVMDPIDGGDGFETDMVPHLVDSAKIYVSETDVASPAYGDEITAESGKVWRVRQIVTQEGMFGLFCVTNERLTF